MRSPKSLLTTGRQLAGKLPQGLTAGVLRQLANPTTAALTLVREVARSLGGINVIVIINFGGRSTTTVWPSGEVTVVSDDLLERSDADQSPPKAITAKDRPAD